MSHTIATPFGLRPAGQAKLKAASLALASRTAFRSEASQYRRLYAATFLLFVIAALLARLLPGRGPFSQAARSNGSILTEAREMAHATLAYAYTH